MADSNPAFVRRVQNLANAQGKCTEFYSCTVPRASPREDVADNGILDDPLTPIRLKLDLAEPRGWSSRCCTKSSRTQAQLAMKRQYGSNEKSKSVRNLWDAKDFCKSSLEGAELKVNSRPSPWTPRLRLERCSSWWTSSPTHRCWRTMTESVDRCEREARKTLTPSRVTSCPSSVRCRCWQRPTPTVSASHGGHHNDPTGTFACRRTSSTLSNGLRKMIADHVARSACTTSRAEMT